MKTAVWVLSGLVLVAGGAGTARAQGSLTPPPGVPGPVMKSLDMLEPRTAITNLPFTISQPGSYYLTTDLTGAAGLDGITITANDVELDLNGFVLSGVGGGDNGIVSLGGQSNIRVHNGTVRNWVGAGVNVAGFANGQLENLRAWGNGVYGIYSGPGSTIVNCTAQGNGDAGIFAGANNTVSGCTANQNALYGFEALQGSTVVDCTAGNNTLSGIYAAGTGCTITRCTARQNGQSGIFTSAGCMIEDCTLVSNTGEGVNANSADCALNRCTARFNGGTGVVIGDGGSARDCTANANNGHGIKAAGTALITGNNCVGNGSGTNVAAGIWVTGNDGRVEGNHVAGGDRGLDIDGTRNYVANNTVQGNTDNYDFAAGNQLNLLLGQIPESVDWPASVKLAGTLTGSAGSNGISINADNVTVDLDGHTLIGGSGTLHGIAVGAPRRNITVRNGTVSRWGQYGVFGTNATYSSWSSLHSASNTFYGFMIGAQSKVVDCVAAYNGSVGFYGSSFGPHQIHFVGCESRGNSGHGYQLEGGCFAERSIANLNGSTGFQLESWNRIEDCEAFGNTGPGLRCNYGNAVIGGRYMDNYGHGIIVEGQRNMIKGTVCTDNAITSGFGIFVSGNHNELDGNHIVGGDYCLYVAGVDNLVTRNTGALGEFSNFNILSGNFASVLAVTPSFTTDNPWVNFSY